MPLPINPGTTTFDTITQNARVLDKNKEAIRGRTDNGVTQLYQHGAKLHGDNVLVSNPLSKMIGGTKLGKKLGMDPTAVQNKQLQRQQKEQQGATWIRGSIDNQYGPGFGARVFQHVLDNQHVNLNNRVLKQDLATIQDAIQALQTADQNATQMIQANTPTVGRPLTALNASVLATIASNPDVSPALRDQAATLLQTNMMNLSAEKREGILTLQPNLVDALVTLRLSNGDRVFSVANLSTIAQEQFQRETPGQRDVSMFFRGNTLATKLLTRIIPDLDGGHIGALGASMQNMVRQATQNQPPTIVYNPQPSANEPNPKPRDIANPAVVNAILNQIDGLLAHQAQQPELHAFLTAVATGIDNGPPVQGAPTGAELTKSAIWLRGLASIVFNTYADKESPQGKLASTVSQALQKATTGHAYVQGQGFGALHNTFYNPGMTTLLGVNSGFNAFQATVP
jgi:hypothetical protein